MTGICRNTLPTFKDFWRLSKDFRTVPKIYADVPKTVWQGAKKVTFTACHSGKLKLTFTSPNIVSTSPKNVLMSRLISQFLCNLDSSQLITEFTSPIAKPTRPGLSDTTFFARCLSDHFINSQDFFSWLLTDIVGRKLMLVTTQYLLNSLDLRSTNSQDVSELLLTDRPHTEF